jgi:hypothetical protein
MITIKFALAKSKLPAGKVITAIVTQLRTMKLKMMAAILKIEIGYLPSNTGVLFYCRPGYEK